MHLVITEKPYITSKCVPAFEALGITEAIALHSMTLGPRRLAFPRGLRFADLPAIQEPRLEARPDHAWTPRLWKDGKLTFLPVGPGASLTWLPDHLGCQTSEVPPERVLVACDGDTTGVMGCLDVLEVLGIAGPVRWLSAGEEGYSGAWAKEAAASARWFGTDLDLARAGRLKRHFDYNWGLNAAPILGTAVLMAQICVFGKVTATASAAPEVSEAEVSEMTRAMMSMRATDNTVMSKYMLLGLYALAQEGKASRAEGRPPVWSLEVFRTWTGSGRYQGRGFGSPCSSAPIVRNLLELGLIQNGEFGWPTDVGRALIDEVLHKDCFDPDLPFRLAGWMDEAASGAEQEARAKADRYIRTLFGKQIRHMAKRRAGAAG